MKKNQEAEELDKNEPQEAQEQNTTIVNEDESPESDNESPESDETEENQEETEKDELAEMKDKYIRMYSEFENFRRRTAKEKMDLINSANADLMEALLPVIDDFERAKASSESGKEDSLKEGFDLIFQKFSKILESNGLKKMDCKQGSEFDTEMHEAISQIPAPKDKLKGKVVDVVEKGYFLRDKVIRFAKVVVGS